MYRERVRPSSVSREDCVALDSYDLPVHTNPVYRDALKANPLADTPLFEARERERDLPNRATPPREIKRSRTQMEALDRLIPTITEKQKTVLAVIKSEGPLTTTAIAERLGWAIHLVSGRIAELQQQGYVVEDGAVVNPATNRRNSLWKATT